MPSSTNISVKEVAFVVISVALFQSALFAGIVAMIMGASKKMFTISQGIEIWVDGMKTLLITCVILICAWSLSSVIKELGTAKFLINYLSDSIPAFTLPSIIFVLGAIISFATGTSYGTMGILMPLAIPLAYSINPDMSYVIVSTHHNAEVKSKYTTHFIKIF